MTSDQLPPIKGFIETSLLDWPGQVCSVLFLPYCNLRCPYCHNHQLVLQPDTLETIPLETILERLTSLNNWIEGICVSGGEPTIHRSLPVLLRRIREAGFKAKLDTNGTQPDMLHYLLTEKLVDYVAMDVKAPLEDEIYARCAGVYVPVSIIRESIRVLMTADVHCEFRCTVTPSLLSESEVSLLAETLKVLRMEVRSGRKGSLLLRLQNFNPADPMEPDLKDTKPFADETFARMQDAVNRIVS
ncbi:MAG: anaerobic ribonucleoside-triphosphate reductase activating protein [Deltaproteobacteria bacterium]|nr:anaerobic ribonucleoside-triphosphate reductase activating protein [Deltaproteobacteria bacterium]